MFESKYSKVLTVILIIIIIAILGLLAFFGYDWYQKHMLESDALAFVREYQDSENETNTNSTSEESNTTEDDPLSQIEEANQNSNTTQQSGTNTAPTYKGYEVAGTMEIPQINFEYPILAKVTPASIETSVAMLCGAGVNQVGNTVIIGHNYRNGLFFSNLKKLSVGDKIYIEDNSGNRLTYTIYNKFETTPDDTSFYQRDTNGKAEVTLSTCTEDSKARTIIFASAE